ncbi:MAG: N-acetylmuramoyl-L-alanine amidase [Eubacteriales bacterium]|nr:N-acetylmuramoyl-L-alanine amidase [Eubacteriales bacterium]
MTLICIDPGHAVSTAGKRSPDGSLREYEFNRAVARRLAYHLERHGLKTMYSCDIDQEADASLDSRCKAANSTGADLFISIHANAFGDGWNAANGWEIYHYPGSVKGKPLADAIHARSKLLGLTDRGVKASDFTVIAKTIMPAVLIEHEFMTNLAAVEKLKAADWREKWAAADAKGILGYLGISWIEEKLHWAEKHLDSLHSKGLINSPEAHRNDLDGYMSKGQIFAMLDRIAK